MNIDVTLSTAQLRDAWSEIQAGRNPLGYRQRGCATYKRIQQGGYRGARVDPFIGCSGDQMQDWLQNGYHPPASDRQMPGGAVEISAPFVDLVEEDGDLLIDQALAGEDLLYAAWQDTPARRGLTISADICLAANTPARVVAEYTTWIMQVVDAAERSGVAPDVEVTFGISHAFTDGRDDLTVHVPLVKGGEIVDSIAWRAFLCPSSLRTLGFLALVMSADKLGRTIAAGLGRPRTGPWSVTLADDTLRISAPKMANEFPAEVMDGLLEAAYANA